MPADLPAAATAATNVAAAGPNTAPDPGTTAAASTGGAPPQRILLGILCMCLAGLLFPFMTGFAKLLGSQYSPLQVSWARAFGHILLLCAVFMPKHGVRLFQSRRPRVQAVRAMLMFSSNLSFFIGVTFIPLAKAASVSLASPLIVALLAWPMLGERTTPGRVVALAFGFLGVLVVIRPGSELFHWAFFLILFSAACYALYQLLTRRIAGFDSPETSTAYTSVVGAFGLLLVLPFIWRSPESLAHLAMFCSLGVLGAIGHYAVVRAMGFAPANLVTPFGYVQLLGSVGVGWLIFGDLPDALTWAGAAIIVGAGLYIGWSQTRARR